MCPVYDYICEECGADVAVNRPSKDYKIPPEKCPGCGTTDKFRRVIGPTSFELKGDGWHRDEYSRTGRSIK